MLISAFWGGSCTGVFAAVRAARLGAKVAIVEQANGFGGVAVNGLVNVWHSFMDTEFKRQIIGGMSQEVVERLKTRGAKWRLQFSCTSGVLGLLLHPNNQLLVKKGVVS